jgi:hypothetical protein
VRVRVSFVNRHDQKLRSAQLDFFHADQKISHATERAEEQPCATPRAEHAMQNDSMGGANSRQPCAGCSLRGVSSAVWTPPGDTCCPSSDLQDGVHGFLLSPASAPTTAAPAAPPTRCGRTRAHADRTLSTADARLVRGRRAMCERGRDADAGCGVSEGRETSQTGPNRTSCNLQTCKPLFQVSNFWI